VVIYSEVPEVYCLHYQDDRNGSNRCCMYSNLNPKEFLTEHIKKSYRNQFVRLQWSVAVWFVCTGIRKNQLNHFLLHLVFMIAAPVSDTVPMGP